MKVGDRSLLLEQGRQSLLTAVREGKEWQVLFGQEGDEWASVHVTPVAEQPEEFLAKVWYVKDEQRKEFETNLSKEEVTERIMALMELIYKAQGSA